MNEKTYGVSVVIPCLNEAETIASAVQEALTGIRNSGLSGEVIVADNGSTDGSQKTASAAGARVVAVPRRGYGAALDAGIRAATSEFVIFADADMSYPFVAVPDLIAPLREKKSDFVLGSRLGGTIEKGAMPWLNRNLGTPVLTFLLRNIYSLPTSDCNSGMRAFRKSTYENLKLSCPGMEYASEMLIRVAQTKTSYSEVPIHFRKDQRSRPPHLKRWQDGWRHLRFILGNSSSPLVASGTLGLGLVFFAIAITISFSSWFWPSQPIHFHTAFMCLALGTPFLLFFVTHVLVKLVRYESGIEQPPIILRLYRWSDRGYAFFGLCFLMFLGLLQSAFLVERWVSANFQNLFEIGALIRLIAIVILAAGLFCLDMGVGLIKLVKIQK